VRAVRSALAGNPRPLAYLFNSFPIVAANARAAHTGADCGARAFQHAQARQCATRSTRGDAKRST
jgi:hypothetical protein